MSDKDKQAGPWHRGYASRKQQVKFEGRKPRKLVSKRNKRKAA